MKKINTIILQIYLTAISLLVPSTILAAPPADQIDIESPPNPLPFGNIVDLINTGINYALSIAGLVAVIFIIIGGFQYTTAAGNEEQSKKATNTLKFAVIGLVIVFAAYAIKVSIEAAIGYQSSGILSIFGFGG